MEEAEVAKQVSPEIERKAGQMAGDRARAARWDLDVAIFLFGVLAIEIILLFQGIGIAIVATGKFESCPESKFAVSQAEQIQSYPTPMLQESLVLA